MILKIIEDGCFLTGGFVRDYLLRGEKFNDIDFFSQHFPEYIKDWRQHRLCYWETHDNIKYHYQKFQINTDLSCNLFYYSLSGGIMARPTIHKYDYEDGFKLLLNKKFRFLGGEIFGLVQRMKSRGWTQERPIFERQKLYAPSGGTWEDYSEIASQRLQRFLTLGYCDELFKC